MENLPWLTKLDLIQFYISGIILVLFGMLFIIAIELKVAINKLDDILDYFLDGGE